MAGVEFMSVAPVTQTDSDSATTESEIYEVPRKNARNRLHGRRTEEAEIHPRAESAQDGSACCELYAHVECRYLPLQGAWLTRAGFVDGMPVKIRAMKDCIVITPQHTRELWGCLEGMSVVNMNKRKVSDWLKTFPGALIDTGDLPIIRRSRFDNVDRSE